MDAILTTFLRFMGFLWVIGIAGCAIAIPVTAYKMVAVLFEHDEPEKG